jgi:flagellar basal body-associated protein FliL
MAKEKEKAPEAPPPEPTAAPKRKLPLMKYGIIAGIVLVQIAAAYFLQKSLFFDTAVEASVVEAVPEEAPVLLDKEGKPIPPAAPAIVILEEIIVNPAGTEGRRYLATRVGFQSSSPNAELEIGSRTALIRDVVISLLSSKSMAQLSSLSYRDTLREEIKGVANLQLKDTKIESVIFADYVLN